MKTKNVEFLLVVKKRVGTNGEPIGLHNNAFLSQQVLTQLGVSCEVEVVVDGNSIDRVITIHKPKYAIIEAIWCPPDKLKELKTLHPDTKFFVRVHSKLPFLSQEGIVIYWLKQYARFDITVVANNFDTVQDLTKIIGAKVEYLPNLYPAKMLEYDFYKELGVINISCFGAIRPLKNQFIQAAAAIEFADELKIPMNFHMNGNRVEQKAEPVLKSIQNLFEDTKHNLVLHPWMHHDQFLKLIQTMDIGMQVSYSESYNIVTADHISMGVPMVISQDIDWASLIGKANTNSVKSQKRALKRVFNFPYISVLLQQNALDRYEKKSENLWKSLILR